MPYLHSLQIQHKLKRHK